MTLWKFLKSTGTSTFGWYIDHLSWLVFLLKKHHGFLDRGCMKTRSNWIGLISSRVKLHPVFLCYEILREMIDSEKTHPNLGPHTCVPHLFWKPNSSGNLIPQTNYNLASLLLFYNDDLKKKHPTNTIDGPSPPKTKALKIVSNETSGIHLSGIHLEHGHTIRILFLKKNAQEAAPWEALEPPQGLHMGSYYCRRKKSHPWIHQTWTVRDTVACYASWTPKDDRASERPPGGCWGNMSANTSTNKFPNFFQASMS